ncbi:tRNA A64-2'-O-ribosylphosphate transferase, partial [Coemansia sp. RSA 1933]
SDVQRLADWDNEVHMPLKIVSESERMQVNELLDSFVDRLVASDIDVPAIAARILKPLRPIWITRDHRLVFPPDFSEAAFIPIICVSASMSASVLEFQSPSFHYVQGAADDQEMWALGLTARLFWKHRTLLLDSADSCEERVQSIVEQSSGDLDGDGNDCARFHFITGTQVAVGDR